jgi:23S rRNA pseudouridine1911/1915/1917 synthase
MPRYAGTIAADSGGKPVRLDVYAASLGILTRSQIRSRNLTAEVNGKAVKRSRLVKPGDKIALFWDDRPPLVMPPENIPLTVLYENDTCIVVDKAQGMVVHPGAGNHRGTLVNALLWRRGLGSLHPYREADTRPFIVHRLDKDTSGVLIAAYTEDALRFLSQQFKTRAVQKTYTAITCGTPPFDRGVIDTFLCRDSRNRKTFMVSADKGKRAVTRYKLIRSWTVGRAGYSLLEVRPRTGRTHQLRVHLRHIGCPILGDPLYAKKDPHYPAATLMLHARALKITLPHGERRLFQTGLPERFAAVIPHFADETGAAWQMKRV